MTTTSKAPVIGFSFAIISAASFALSGIFASGLMSAGWSPGAATTARITFAGLVLLIPTLVLMRGHWGAVKSAWGTVMLFGLLAVAGCQLAFFIAVQFIAPSLALLIEFMGPVLLMFWLWFSSKKRPAALTLVGAATAVLGLVAISGIGFGESLHPLGIIFGLIAAVGNATYYATGAQTNHGIPALPFVGLGLLVAAVTLLIVGGIGLLPIIVTAEPAVIAGMEFSPVVVVAAMVLISTVVSYVFGVGASRRLGATVSSFAGYAEPLFGIVWTILLLSILPTTMQWIGALLIIAGVVTVKLGELRS